MKKARDKLINIRFNRPRTSLRSTQGDRQCYEESASTADQRLLGQETP